MNDAVESLCPQEILLDLDVSSRWEALRAVSAAVGRGRRLNPDAVLRSLWRREQAASTALGNGFALPHARITEITQPVTVYVRTKAPIFFAAPDHAPVADLLVLLVPSDAEQAKHLQLLALAAEMFSDRKFRKDLRAAPDAAGIRASFRRWFESRDRRASLTRAA